MCVLCIHIMDSVSSRRQRTQNKATAEEQALDQIAKEAEQRLAARRAARAEAREIRMRELERQQKEQEEHADKAYDMYSETLTTRRLVSSRLASGFTSPRRSSEDSVDDTFSVKDLRYELRELEEKFRKAMILNAQLDNDKSSLTYQLEALKDNIEDLHEEHEQLRREHREKCSQLERSRREATALATELRNARRAVMARERAIANAGYSLVDDVDSQDLDDDIPALALVSAEAAELLQSAGEGTLDVRLQKLHNDRQALESEVRRLKIALNEEQTKHHNGLTNGDHESYESEVEAVRRACAEQKARAARAEAEAALSAAAVARLEATVARLRTSQQQQEELEEQLKQDKRKLQREAREALNRVEELETENGHLTKRLDKLKNAKSTLLKEL